MSTETEAPSNDAVLIWYLRRDLDETRRSWSNRLDCTVRQAEDRYNALHAEYVNEVRTTTALSTALEESRAEVERLTAELAGRKRKR